jgi:S1-C subfamily serine protease
LTQPTFYALLYLQSYQKSHVTKSGGTVEFYLEFLKGHNEGETRSFHELELLRVGRNPGGELILEDLGVSFDHAEVRLRGEAFWLVDRGSTNGSFINGERAYNSKIREGDILKFGKRGPEVRYRSRRPANMAASGALKAASSGRHGAAAIIEGPVRKKREAARQRVAVQVNEPEPAPIPEPSVSRRKASPDPDQSSESVETRSAVLPIVLSLLFVGSLVLAIFFGLQMLETGEKYELQQQTMVQIKDDLRTKDKTLTEKLSAIESYERDLSDSQERLRESRTKLEKAGYTHRRDSRVWLQEKKTYKEQLQEKSDQIKTLKAQVSIFEQNSGGQGGSSDRVTFQKIQKIYNESVVLIFTSLMGKDQNGKKVNLSCSGTGFILTREGHIVTNKHVIQPWKFSKMAQKLAREGIVVDPKSHHVAIWLAGSRFINRSNRRLNLSTGFSTQAKSLEINSLATDEWRTMDNSSPKGPRKFKIHSPRSNADVAILKITTGKTFKHVIPYGPTDLPIEKLDAVMVLGFPLGTSILEREIAETSPNMGEVRKVEDSIWIAGSMHHGNSGGPVFNRSGRVIGISTRIVGSENLGACIKIQHALKLLGGIH